MTPAQSTLAKHQRRRPPCYPLKDGLDRARQIYRVLEPALPAPLREFVSTGRLAIGEVGRFQPEVFTLETDGGGFVIEFYTGMMDFVYAVARALAGVHVGRGKTSTPDAPKPLELGGVVSLVTGVLAEWKRHFRWSWIWPVRRIQHATFHIDPHTLRWIETLATCAEAFMLAHELGHVATDGRLLLPLQPNDEENADAHGLQFFLAASSHGPDLRFPFAGAVFAIKLLCCLERSGFRFSTAYPPQERRLQLLQQAVRARCPSEQYYLEASTIAVAYQDLLDDVENRIAKGTPPVEPGPERTLVRLLAELQEVALGRVPADTFVKDLQDLAQRLSVPVFDTAVARFVLLYAVPGDAPSYLSLEMRARMAQALYPVMNALPKDLQHRIAAATDHWRQENPEKPGGK